MCVFVMMSVVSFVYLCELYGKLVCVRAISIIKTIIIIENVQHISISYGHSCKGREGEGIVIGIESSALLIKNTAMTMWHEKLPFK